MKSGYVLFSARFTMDELPAIELLEANHTFPGTYTFKAIGQVENGFVARVVAAVRDELGDAVDPPFRVREAVGRRHESPTVQPAGQTAQEVLTRYRRVR